MIEAFLEGREISSGVYQSYTGIHVLPLTEIKTENEFFDYAAKYEGASDEITPAEISVAATEMIQEQTQNIYEKLNLRGICRVDYMLTETGPVLIELNTVPGFSAESIIPQIQEKEMVEKPKLGENQIAYERMKRLEKRSKSLNQDQEEKHDQEKELKTISRSKSSPGKNLFSRWSSDSSQNGNKRV